MSDESDVKFLSNDSKYGLIIEYKFLQQMLLICEAAEDLEVGGIVIGTYDAEHRYALVKSVLEPPRDSLHSKRWFKRGIAGLQTLLNKYWYKKQFYYLGEWHFHPNASAGASTIDIEQMRTISQSTTYNCPEPILIILGGNPRGTWEIRSYVFPRNRTWMELKKI